MPKLLANVYQRRWQWADAEAEYKRALELDPNDAAAHVGYASWLLCQGRTEEALDWSRRARDLDPLGVSGAMTGWILFQARRYDEAIRELRSVLAVHPENATADYFLGFALIANGQPEEAIIVLNKAFSLTGGSPGYEHNTPQAFQASGGSSWTMPIYRALSLNVSLIESYLNNPQPGFKRNSLQFTSGFQFAVR